MIAPDSQKPVFRFAPSPNGPLHLGHALSAMLNFDAASAAGGRFLLRMEDIDITRCTPEFEAAIYEDLAWLGLRWDMPVRRQSEHLDAYRAALDRLRERGLIYPAFLTRGEVRAYALAEEARGTPRPRDPDGAYLYPPTDRDRSETERARLLQSGAKHAWRLDMRRALESITGPLHWIEKGDGSTTTIAADPPAWGDVVLWRSDAPSSYHLSVVVDDALQGITEVIRGRDLFSATAVHRLLQALLDLPAPTYRHHRLILDRDGRKLSKSAGDTGLSALRANGLSPLDIRRLVGL
ncbi:tRNA glutamyl-Q(34) synthetase GluQRS [Agrobacterium sp. a22-2]|uniref:tRNA glutamyl-Q(34) synthetase GluQRS n=1 Tax=Agrobacterium sp. a22-2 TaxID=2283840 RepID=UPI001446EB0C|nr:tRNA glutamyl-Q(34) synthetase GluQRS [Agrobacterium sp. a22-2]NKN37075.1 tRNA glutamyl-Q(34) synthetase GluQRS [Agrobacterium sp. a22-2]